MNLFWETVKMLVVLGLVLMAIVFVMKYGVARLQPGGMGNSGIIKVLERVPVGPKSILLLVNVGEDNFLLGVSADRINFLAKVTPDESFSQVLERTTAGGTDTLTFKRVKEMFRKGAHGGQNFDEDDET